MFDSKQRLVFNGRIWGSITLPIGGSAIGLEISDKKGNAFLELGGNVSVNSKRYHPGSPRANFLKLSNLGSPGKFLCQIPGGLPETLNLVNLTLFHRIQDLDH